MVSRFQTEKYFLNVLQSKNSIFIIFFAITLAFLRKKIVDNGEMKTKRQVNNLNC